MGLHTDGSERGYTAVETHRRRLIWYQLLCLDIRTAEAQGPFPVIRDGDFTTEYPFNVNDRDFQQHKHEVMESDKWTEMTVPLIRFMCNEFIRWIWIARKQLREKRISVTTVIKKIEAFRADMNEKFIPTLDQQRPIQRYCFLLLEIQTLRTYAMVLHPYHMHPTMEMPGELLFGVYCTFCCSRAYTQYPDKLKKLLIQKGIDTMEYVIELETSQTLAQWFWYAGAYQQHHFALLMLMEIFLHPRRTDAERIWHGLDYVFQSPPIPRVQRAHWLMEYIQRQMEVYQKGRKLRVGRFQMREASLSTESSFASSSDSRPKTESSSEDISPKMASAAVTMPSTTNTILAKIPASVFEPQALHRDSRLSQAYEYLDRNMEMLDFNDVS